MLLMYKVSLLNIFLSHEIIYLWVASEKFYIPGSVNSLIYYKKYSESFRKSEFEISEFETYKY